MQSCAITKRHCLIHISNGGELEQLKAMDHGLVILSDIVHSRIIESQNMYNLFVKDEKSTANGIFFCYLPFCIIIE